MQDEIQRIGENFDIFEYLNSLENASYVVDSNRTIIFWSDMAQELTGYPREFVLGKRCMDDILKHEDNFGVNLCKTDLCPLFRTMKSNKIEILPFSVNALNKKNEKRISFDVFAAPLNVNGEIMGGIEFFSPAKDADELKRAMRIQASLMPVNLSEEIELFYHPSNSLGGDMIFMKDPWIAVFDVSGHGMSSALISSGIIAILNEILDVNSSFEEIGDKLEERYSLFDESEIYFTCLLMKKAGNHIDIVSFGHPSPMLKTNAGYRFVEMENDYPIGWNLGKHNSKAVSIDLQKDDYLLAYTDGFTETKTVSAKDGGGIIGNQGMIDIFRNVASLEEAYIRSQEINKSVFQEDDITLLRIYGK